MATLILGDTHFPFVDHKALKFAYKAIEKEKPKNIVQIGDLYDLFSMSRFPKNPDFITPHREIELAHEAASNMWDTIRNLAPKAKCHQILGNHCIRPKKISLERCPELYPFVAKSWGDLFKFKGVDTLMDIRDELIIDEVVYEHGFYGKPGQHLKENLKSTVIGHSHRPWVHFEKLRRQTLFELNVGYLADPSSEALAYTRKKWNKWVQGYGVVRNGMPVFIPFIQP